MPLFWVHRKVIWGSDTNNQLPTKDKNNQKSIKAKNEPQQNREIYDFPEATRGLINFFFRIDIETPSCRFLQLGNFYGFINGEHIPTRGLLIAPHLSIFTEDKSELESREREASVCRPGRLTKKTKNDLWGKYFDRLWIGGTWPVSICFRLASTRIINYIPMAEKLSGAKLEKKRKMRYLDCKIVVCHLGSSKSAARRHLMAVEGNRDDALEREKIISINFDHGEVVWIFLKKIYRQLSSGESSNLGFEPNSKQFFNNSTSVSSSQLWRISLYIVEAFSRFGE